MRSPAKVTKTKTKTKEKPKLTENDYRELTMMLWHYQDECVRNLDEATNTYWRKYWKEEDKKAERLWQKVNEMYD